MNNHKREYLNPEEMDELYNACENQTERLFVCLGIEAGFRISEADSLRREHIQWQDGTITVWGKGSGRKGDLGEKKKRIVPFSHSTKLKELLSNFFAIHDKLPYGIRAKQKWIKRIAGRTSIAKKVDYHTLRHSFATNALRKDVSLISVSQVMGHESLKTTQVYLHNLGKHNVKAFQEKW